MTLSFFNFIYRVLMKLSRIFLKLANKWKPLNIQQRNIIRSTKYNMLQAPDEPYYVEQYWKVIHPYLDELSENSHILDLGCGQGRFTLKLAKLFNQGHVIGCDLSATAITQAKEYATRSGLSKNIEYRTQSITDCLASCDEKSMDVILLTEVTVFYPEWQDDMPLIKKILKPGGILILSFRSLYFNALCSIRNRSWESIDTLLNERYGNIFGHSLVFTWQHSSEIKEFIVESYGLELLELSGIGVCSGIKGDPHDYICKPSKLTIREREQLMKLELNLGKHIPDGGRYILVVARNTMTS